MIPLFDSLTHVTADGRWFNTQHNGSVDRLRSCLGHASPAFACVVGIAGYNMPNDFIRERCAESGGMLVPVAGVITGELASAADALAAVRALRQQGFRAIKIHPTLCNDGIESKEFDWTMDACASVDMPVFLCTIMRRRGFLPGGPPAELIYRAFARHSAVRALLVHGGLSEVMLFADVVRGLPNTLLDLSLTLLKYRGSSIDQDIGYLFRTFDQRLTVGSDFPEWTPLEVRHRVEELAGDLAPAKLENILWRNLAGFLGVSLPIEFRDSAAGAPRTAAQS